MFKNFLVIVSIGILMLGMGSTVYAEVLDFEGLSDETGYVTMSSEGATNYAGFTWNLNFGLVHDSYYLNTEGNTYDSPSGDYAVFNWNGLPGLNITRTSLFDFTGANFSAWAKNDAPFVSGHLSSATSITVYGYNGADLVDSVSMTLSTDQYNWLQADISDINRLVFQTQGATANSVWLMDDFTYGTMVIPEQVSSTLFIIGGATLGFRRFLKKISGVRSPFFRKI
jgi:hypothetical protein